MKNWFGLESHPTDSLIHWKTRDKERFKEAERLRAAYDKIVAAGLKDELDILTSAHYDMGRIDEYESTCEGM